MDKQLSPGLKTTFLIHAIVATLFGLAYLLIPKKFGSLVNWPVMEPEAYRIIGAAILAFAASIRHILRGSSSFRLGKRDNLCRVCCSVHCVLLSSVVQGSFYEKYKFDAA
jgi:hypothetical protein